MADVNISRVYQTPNAPTGSNPANTFTKVKDAPVIRGIPPIKEYNPETGLDQTVTTFGDEPSEAAKTAKKEAKKETDQKSSHEKWKEQQQAKRDAQQQTKYEKAASQQVLAKDFLQKGDITSAAKALGITPQELIHLTNQAALSIPEKKKELTPQEKKEQDEYNYRKSLETKLNDMETWKTQQIAQNFMDKNIVPLISNVKDFPLINNGDVPKVQQFVYDYMNQHYQDTTQYGDDGKVIKEGEVLNAKDVLQEIENNFEKEAIAALEKLQGVEKLQKYLSPKQKKEMQAKAEEVEPQLGEDDVDLEDDLTSNVSRPPSVKSLQKRNVWEAEDEDNDSPPPRQVSRRTSQRKVPFALLSSEEKMEALRNGTY